jgi:hypothetical protein
MLADVGAVKSVFTAGFQEASGEDRQDEDAGVAAGCDDPIQLCQGAAEQGERSDHEVTDHVKQLVFLRTCEGNQVSVLV